MPQYRTVFFSKKTFRHSSASVLVNLFFSFEYPCPIKYTLFRSISLYFVSGTFYLFVSLYLFLLCAVPSLSRPPSLCLLYYRSVPLCFIAWLLRIIIETANKTTKRQHENNEQVIQFYNELCMQLAEYDKLQYECFIRFQCFYWDRERILQARVCYRPLSYMLPLYAVDLIFGSFGWKKLLVSYKG